jgi:hypothetical protein
MTVKDLSWPFLSVRTIKNAIERLKTVKELGGTLKDARRFRTPRDARETVFERMVTGWWLQRDGELQLILIYLIFLKNPV